MVDILNLYLDDSGTRRPDRKPGRIPAHGYDYFALGGILIKEQDESLARQVYDEFCERWNISYPLHSSEIRAKSGNFKWVGTLDEAGQQEFLESLYQLMRMAPVVGHACVIDRPGYNHRYLEKYGRRRWLLCKTAFNVVAERSAKYALSLKYKLRIMPEKCNPKEDNHLCSYYEILKANGMPFAGETSEKYAPLSANQFASIFYEFKLKEKSSPMAQIADVYLWPMCMGGYHASNWTYKRLLEDGKLVDSLLPERDVPILGIKYSCFDLVKRKP